MQISWAVLGPHALKSRRVFANTRTLYHRFTIAMDEVAAREYWWQRRGRVQFEPENRIHPRARDSNWYRLVPTLSCWNTNRIGAKTRIEWLQTRSPRPTDGRKLISLEYEGRRRATYMANSLSWKQRRPSRI